jgi:hypothetical protein
MRLLILSSNPGAKKCGLMATKHWPRSAGLFVFSIQRRILGPKEDPAKNHLILIYGSFAAVTMAVTVLRGEVH